MKQADHIRYMLVKQKNPKGFFINKIGPGTGFKITFFVDLSNFCSLKYNINWPNLISQANSKTYFLFLALAFDDVMKFKIPNSKI